MQYEHITTKRQLVDFCGLISEAKSIAFDTEFVSEDSYRPQLCLVQVAAAGRLAVIDPLAVEDLTDFWKLLAAPGHETIVHAGREEFRFCLQAIGGRPGRLFDIQIAAALVGLDYPASYGALISKLLGKTLGKGETRTDWRRRPLSERQFEYALQDVLFLEPLRDILSAHIDKLGRQRWLNDEMAAWQAQVEAAETSERWRRVSGISGLSRRMLAIVRELWRWRDAEAQRRNWPPKRILRDDLIVELARRQSADLKRIRAVRGLDRGDIQRRLPHLATCIEQALALPGENCPEPARGAAFPQLNLLSQYLSTALGSICRSAQVAPSLAGSVQDIRDLIAYRLELNGSTIGRPPVLAQGWRAEVVGQVIDDLLDGKLAIHIADPLSEQPLSFEPRNTES